MPDEFTPDAVPSPPSAADLPDIEKFADSDDADVIASRAKLIEAQAKLTKASTPLLDKFVLRGLIPLALAIVGPWALWEFNTEQAKQGEVIVKLEGLLEQEKTARKAREKELHAMSEMVCRLDDTLKAALVQMAVAQALAADEMEREEAVENIAEQMAFPNIDERAVRKLAGESYDRLSKRK